jgi:hypothetical protein
MINYICRYVTKKRFYTTVQQEQILGKQRYEYKLNLRCLHRDGSASISPTLPITRQWGRAYISLSLSLSAHSNS